MAFLRRRWRRTLLIAVLLWLLVSAALVGTAYGDATRGRTQIEALRTTVNGESLRSGEFEVQLAAANASLLRAHWKLANPLVAPFKLVPYFGRQLSSAVALTGTAATITDASNDAITEARTLTDQLETDRAGTLARLGTIAAEADARIATTTLGPDDALFPKLADARNQLNEQVTDIHATLQQASSGALAFADLLKGNGKYLLVAANNGEMRAGAGMFLSVGTLSAPGGNLQVSDLETVGTVLAPDGSVPWPDDMKARWGWIGFNSDFRNLMMSPRFDQSAPLAAQVYEKAGKGSVDGVMMIDPVFLQNILRATGPVQAGSLRVSADNVVQQLLVDQYRSINLRTSTVAAQEARREGLGGIADATFSAISSGRWDAVTMARSVGAAARSRHLMVWAKGADRNRQWMTAGVGGTLTENSLLLSSINVGANKTDQFLRINADVEQRLSTSGIDMTVRISIANRTPGDVPGYVTGPTPGYGLERAEYSGILAANVPQDARNLRFDGSPPLVALGADGPSQTIGTRVRVKAGQTVTFTLRFTRSPSAQFTTIEASGRYPATTWRYGNESFVDDGPYRLQH